MASLRERLLGRTSPPAPGTNGKGAPSGTPPAASPALPVSETRAGTPSASRPAVGPRISHTFSHKIEAPALSPVDQLKVDLHRRLIDRLDLEALEAIKDEAVLIQQIRNAVVEFLRTEPTPLSQVEREEVIEQIVYEVTGLGPIEPLFRDWTIT